jgi:3-methyl-2-oxobutanoate hydroxymethyltransferase
MEMSRRITVPAVASSKVAGGAEPLVMVTAYDAPTARVASDAGVDLILVGDSVAMVVLGYDDTLSVTIDDMAHHVAAVCRTRPSPLVVGDLPWMSYHAAPADAQRNAATLVRAGADAVKLEGGTKRLAAITAILDAEIPVMGHLGLTPQSVRATGGYRVQARTADAAVRLVDDAVALADAGCFAIVLEGVPDMVAEIVTAAVDVPTIGIGAGSACDGQVLVLHDLCGITPEPLPRFVRRYGDTHTAMVDMVGRFADDVRHGDFPSPAETYRMPDDEAVLLAVTGAVTDADLEGGTDPAVLLG